MTKLQIDAWDIKMMIAELISGEEVNKPFVACYRRFLKWIQTSDAKQARENALRILVLEYLKTLKQKETEA